MTFEYQNRWGKWEFRGHPSFVKEKNNFIVAKVQKRYYFKGEVCSNSVKKEGECYELFLGPVDGPSIGAISIYPTHWGFYETHCYGLRSGSWLIKKAPKNQGWGIELYYQMLKWGLENNIKIRSSKISSNKDFSMTIDAQRVWESKRLREKVKIIKDNDRFIVKGLN